MDNLKLKMPLQKAQPKGPAWMNRIAGGVGNMFNRMGAAPAQFLSPQEQQAAQQQQRMAMIASLLQSAAPVPKGTGSGLAGIGTAIQAGQAANQQFTADALRARLMASQMQGQERAEPAQVRIARILADPNTPEAVKTEIRAQMQPPANEFLKQPIPVNQLPNVRFPDGSAAVIGMSYEDAVRGGATVSTATDRTNQAAADQAAGVLNSLQNLAVGPNGLFNEVQPGLLNRAEAAIRFAFDKIDQGDPRASQYADMSRGAIAPIVRYMGEKGALAEGDVQRALGLVPRLFPLPDSGEVARSKFAELQAIIDKGFKKAHEMGLDMSNMGGDSMPPLPPGYTLDQ